MSYREFRPLAEIESGLGPFFDPAMLHYPTPSDLTREQFHSLVSSLCSQLKSSGLDPQPVLPSSIVARQPELFAEQLHGP